MGINDFSNNQLSNNHFSDDNLSDEQHISDDYQMSDQEYFAYINESDEDFNARWDKIHKLIQQINPNFSFDPVSSIDSFSSTSNLSPNNNSNNNSDLEHLDNQNNIVSPSNNDFP